MRAAPDPRLVVKHVVGGGSCGVGLEWDPAIAKGVDVELLAADECGVVGDRGQLAANDERAAEADREADHEQQRDDEQQSHEEKVAVFVGEASPQAGHRPLRARLR